MKISRRGLNWPSGKNFTSMRPSLYLLMSSQNKQLVGLSLGGADRCLPEPPLVLQGGESCGRAKDHQEDEQAYAPSEIKRALNLLLLTIEFLVSEGPPPVKRKSMRFPRTSGLALLKNG